MRMSDWSSDVCSSDLSGRRYRWPMPAPARAPRPEPTWAGGGASARERRSLDEPFRPTHPKFGVRMSDDLEGGMEKKQRDNRSEEHTSELQSLMRTSYAVFCLKKKNYNSQNRLKIKITNQHRTREKIRRHIYTNNKQY